LLLCVGRLEAYKRVDRAILALAHLPEHYRLVIIGDGAEKTRLERLVVAHGLTQRVQLLGRMSDAALERYYRMAHAVITCSEAESFGRVVVEALAYRCQVICSDIPAFRDLASDHPQSITLVRSGMPDQQLAALIDAAAARPTLRANVQRYSWQSVTAQLLWVYGASITNPRAEATRPGITSS
jgi:glycosyltransferase involved in cell wall biosynthesis